MTTYFVTFALVGYFLLMSQMTSRKDEFNSGALSLTNPSRVFLFLSAATLIVVAGLRWRVGTDYTGYAKGYDPDVQLFLESLVAFDEPGIRGLGLIASVIYDDYATLIFLASLITIGLMLWAIGKWSPAPEFSLALFVLAGAWHGSFNGVRQYLAAAILLAGHRLVVERKLIPFLMVVGAAGLFHVSALAGIFLYLVPRRRLSIFGMLALLGLSVAGTLSTEAALNVISDFKGSPVLNTYATTIINPLRIAVAVLPSLLYWLAEDSQDVRGAWFYKNMAFVHGATMIAVSESAYLGRMGIYTGAFVPISVAFLVKFEDRNLTAFARFLVLVLFGVFWYMDVAPREDLSNFLWVFERKPL